MRFIENIKWFLLIPVYPKISLGDKIIIAYHYLQSLLFRFVLKKPLSNKKIQISFNGFPLYFRENWFDSRDAHNIFANDYTDVDKDIFKNLRTFVDVGANLGFISRCANLNSPKCQIFCFEALPENAELAKLNNPSASVEQVGIGSKTGEVELLVDSFGFMASSLKFDYVQQKRKIKMVRLDDCKLPEKIDLLKIDVEGMEMEVLAGASETLKKTDAVIAEIHSDRLLGDFHTVMSKAGFLESAQILVDTGVYICKMKRRQ